MHSQESWTDFYSIYVASVGRNAKSLPEPAWVTLPATAGVYEAKDWWVTTAKAGPCFLPEGGLVTVTSLSKTKLIGSVIWPHRYRPEALRCRDRQLPREGLCQFDREAPSVPVCGNGSMVLIDLAEAVDVDGRPIDASVPMEGIRKALGL